MEIHKFKESFQAAEFALSLLKKYQETEINLCLTGGRFGSNLNSLIRKSNLNISNWKIFQTDERINSTDKETIQLDIQKNIQVCRGYTSSNVFFLPKTLRELSNNSDLISSNASKDIFDLVFLSLGEDGHLGGHFYNSEFCENEIYCFTNNAPKKPRKRISYTMNYIFESKKIVLSCFGKSKKDALQDFLSGEGLHSFMKNHKDIILLTDL